MELHGMCRVLNNKYTVCISVILQLWPHYILRSCFWANSVICHLIACLITTVIVLCQPIECTINIVLSIYCTSKKITAVLVVNLSVCLNQKYIFTLKNTKKRNNISQLWYCTSLHSDLSEHFCWNLNSLICQ